MSTPEPRPAAPAPPASPEAGGFAGAFGPGARAAAAAWAAHGAARLAAEPRFALVRRTGEAREAGGPIPPVTAAVQGTPRFDDPELSRRAREDGAASALAEGFRARGTEVLAKLLGPFAAVVHDAARDQALVATDRAGERPVYYARLADGVAFSTSLELLLDHPGVSGEIDPQAVYDYVYFHAVPAPRTIYRGVQRLLPGEAIVWSEERTCLLAYWTMAFPVDPAFRTEPARRGDLKRVLGEAVARAVDDRPAGAFLSGGTDSSTLTGLLGEVTGAAPQVFSIGFAAEGYDETEYARIAARHFGAELHEQRLTPGDVLAAVPEVAAYYEQPFGNASAVPTLYCARLARDHGIELLLGGDGGDELFGGNERYAKQRLFAPYDRLPAGLRRGILEPLALGSRLTEVGPLKKLRSYVAQARIPLPERLETYNLLERVGAERVFDAAYLEGIDRGDPAALMREAYTAVAAPDPLNRMLGLDLRFTLADSDLPKVAGMCDLAGVGVRFPFLDEEVVTLAGRLPPDLKVKGTRLRYYFKEALRDFLPPAVLTKSKHGFGLPFGVWLATEPALRELAFDSLAALAGRGIVRAGLVDELRDERLAEHAAYYGTLVWVLMMLEQWLAQR